MTRPAYLHNRVLMKLLLALGKYFGGKPNGEVLLSENLYALSASTRRSPDAAVILGDRRKDLAGDKVIPVIPDIAAELLSPSESTTAIHRKPKQYFQAGVKGVWLVQPEDRTVEIWSGPSLPEQALTRQDGLTSALLPGFTLPLADLFS